MHRESIPRRGSAGERSFSGGEAKLLRALKPRDKVEKAGDPTLSPSIPKHSQC